MKKAPGLWDVENGRVVPKSAEAKEYSTQKGREDIFWKEGHYFALFDKEKELTVRNECPESA